jgi:hypothetical protein
MAAGTSGVSALNQWPSSSRRVRLGFSFLLFPSLSLRFPLLHDKNVTFLAATFDNLFAGSNICYSCQSTSKKGVFLFVDQ